MQPDWDFAAENRAASLCPLKHFGSLLCSFDEAYLAADLETSCLWPQEGQLNIYGLASDRARACSLRSSRRSSYPREELSSAFEVICCTRHKPALVLQRRLILAGLIEHTHSKFLLCLQSAANGLFECSGLRLVGCGRDWGFPVGTALRSRFLLFNALKDGARWSCRTMAKMILSSMPNSNSPKITLRLFFKTSFGQIWIRVFWIAGSRSLSADLY